MELTRRGFVTKAAATVGVLATLPLDTACFVGSVYKDILEYGPVALAALDSVLSILQGNGIAISPMVGNAVQLYKTGIADLQAAVSQYQNAPQGQKSTRLQKVSEALAIAEANINRFWSDLQIPDPKLASLVEGLLGVVTTTMAGFATQLPPASQGAKAMRASLGKRLDSTPVKRSVKQLRHDFNALLEKNGESLHAI